MGGEREKQMQPTTVVAISMIQCEYRESWEGHLYTRGGSIQLMLPVTYSLSDWNITFREKFRIDQHKTFLIMVIEMASLYNHDKTISQK